METRLSQEIRNPYCATAAAKAVGAKVVHRSEFDAAHADGEMLPEIHHRNDVVDRVLRAQQAPGLQHLAPEQVERRQAP